MFFFISGYFVHQKRLLDEKILLDTKRFMTLLKVYLFWALAGFILCFSANTPRCFMRGRLVKPLA